jgi:hypothetical protein
MVAREGRGQENIHHRAFGLEGQSGGGRNSAAAADFFASAVGCAKSFVSNSHGFCFLGATERRDARSNKSGSKCLERWEEMQATPRLGGKIKNQELY